MGNTYSSIRNSKVSYNYSSIDILDSQKDNYGLMTFTPVEDYDIELRHPYPDCRMSLILYPQYHCRTRTWRDRENTWTDLHSGNLWLRDFLPSDLPTARVMSFGYNATTLFSQVVTNIDNMVEALLAATHVRRRSTNGTAKPIIFICHSLGGIIVKKASILRSRMECQSRMLIPSRR